MTDATINQLINELTKKSELLCAANAEWLALQPNIATMTGPEALNFYAKTLRETNQ